MLQKRAARKSSSGGLCFTLFTKLCRFGRTQPLPAATVGYREERCVSRVFIGIDGSFTYWRQHGCHTLVAARERKQAYFEALDANVPVVHDQDDAGRANIKDAV